MTQEEIKELFIRAAETDRKLPRTEGPKPVKGQSLPFVHTWEDQIGWGEERYSEERAEFWAGYHSRISRKDIADHELCNELILLVDDNFLTRHALWGWAIAKAGGTSFANWCKKKRISKTWASELKNRAIMQIATGLALKVSQNSQTGAFDTLSLAPQIIDNSDTVAVSRRSFSWRDDTAFSAVAGEHDFSWSNKRNALRRQRRQQKNKKASSSRAESGKKENAGVA